MLFLTNSENLEFDKLNLLIKKKIKEKVTQKLKKNIENRT